MESHLLTEGCLCYVLKEKEDPNAYLKKCPLSCPDLIVSPSNRHLAVGDVPISKRQGYQGCFIPYGLLLYPSPYIPKVCSPSAFSHTDGGPLGQNP